MVAGRSTLRWRQWAPLLHACRALPTAAGSALGWDFRTIHWGSVCHRAAEPRISIAAYFVPRGFPRRREERRLFDPHRVPSFRDRLWAIAFSIRYFKPNDVRNLRYLALAKGRFQRDRGTIDLRLPEHQQTAVSRQQRGVNMQQAVTHWKLLGSGPEAALLELDIETGRTHQIRRHLAAIGHPVVGDGKYGDFPFNRRAKSAFGLKRMFLHSAQLTVHHPVTNKRLSLQAPLPAELAEVLPRAGISWKG